MDHALPFAIASAPMGRILLVVMLCASTAAAASSSTTTSSATPPADQIAITPSGQVAMHPPPAFVAASDELFYFPLSEVDAHLSLGFRAATIREYLEDQRKRAGVDAEERTQQVIRKLEAEERRPEVRQLYRRLVAKLKLGSGAPLHDADAKAAEGELAVPRHSHDVLTKGLGALALVGGALFVYFAFGALRLSRWWWKRYGSEAQKAVMREVEAIEAERLSDARAQRDGEAWEAKILRDATAQRQLRRSTAVEAD